MHPATAPPLALQPSICAALPADAAAVPESLWKTISQELSELSAKVQAYADAGVAAASDMTNRVWNTMQEWLEAVQVRTAAGPGSINCILTRNSICTSSTCRGRVLALQSEAPRPAAAERGGVCSVACARVEPVLPRNPGLALTTACAPAPHLQVRLSEHPGLAPLKLLGEELADVGHRVKTVIVRLVQHADSGKGIDWAKVGP